MADPLSSPAEKCCVCGGDLTPCEDCSLLTCTRYCGQCAWLRAKGYPSRLFAQDGGEHEATAAILADWHNTRAPG